ncbi:MAG: ATP-binding protein, partial [Methanocorpusculum sp.]|nr:ATP-binding protein [Methanocorpusculum sp.]
IQSINMIINSIMLLCKTTLELQKYTCTTISYDVFAQIFQRVSAHKIRAIVKDERVENLQNSILPYCYSYDKFPENDSDLSKIVSALINHPYCAVSFQIIPTEFSTDEINVIGQTRQYLETLTKGITDQGVGTVSFSVAEKEADTYSHYSYNKNNGLFLFNILVYGKDQDVVNISTQVYGQVATNREKSVNLRFVELAPENVQKDTNFYPLPWAVSEMLIQSERNLTIWNSGSIQPSYFRLPYIITADEASEFFRLPIGSDTIGAGLPVTETDRSSKKYFNDIINSGDLSIGKLKSSVNGDSIGLSLNDLAKHMLVVGTPGSGKTTFSVGVLDRLWKDHNIPFLVIEPAKNEYRALIQSIPEIQIFTPGKNFISPFVFNPFVPPKNVKLEAYKSTLKTAFSAAVSMSTPLDKIFEESINNCYSDFRWLDTYTLRDKGKIFNISDFIKCFRETFDAIGYTGDAKNIGRAGVVRLTTLINLFDNYHSIPIEDLLNKPTIIELAAIENSDQKALIISLLLLSILSYVNSNYVGEGGLKNVILLEEAHVLLDAESSGGGTGEANPSAIAQGLVKRMLAEIRSYGVGLIIADQSPRKVGIDVVALTDIKMAFRLVEATDKQIIADSSNLSETQIPRLGKLKPGEAFLFFNKLDEPEEVLTDNYRLEHNINITLTDDGIKSLSHYWDDKKQILRPYPECQYIPYCQEDCNSSTRLLGKEIARRIYAKNFKLETTDFEVLKNVFAHITRLTKAELNDEPFNNRLMSCVKCHLLRRVRYDTKIRLSDGTIMKTLKKGSE